MFTFFQVNYNLKGPGAKRSNYQNQVLEKIKKQSLKPHHPNYRAIIVAKSVFSSARIIRECKFAISINFKNFLNFNFLNGSS